jgi:hypothetical protein
MPAPIRGWFGSGQSKRRERGGVGRLPSDEAHEEIFLLIRKKRSANSESYQPLARSDKDG